MGKLYLAKIVAFITLLILLAGFVFFRKDENEPELSQSELERQQLIESVKEQRKNKELPKEDKEKNKIKAMAGNFASIYYSYSWGNFSNIKSQYGYMTDEMKNREKNKVEQMKKEIENQPQKYFTARAKLTDSTFISYSETKASLKINLSIDNFAGAIVQRDTMVWVDERGDYYEGDAKNLIVNTVDKNVEIILIKIDDEWKVDEIGEKQK